jgi:cytidylate kinase
MINPELAKCQLWVVESSGSPRSGKGTITNALAQAYPDSAQDETGADYRAVTLGLLADSHIAADMPEDTIARAINSLQPEQITDYAARRYEIVAEYGSNALYSPEVSKTVGKISPYDIVRSAVKQGFTRRVEVRVADPDVNILFVDGRNLSNVIEKIPGAMLGLRLFVDCQPSVAAVREAKRNNVDLSDIANNDWFETTKAEIKKRKQDDENRVNDPVAPEQTAIKYWHNGDVMSETELYIAKTRGLSPGVVAELMHEKFRAGGRRGAGAKAVAERRQIYFDTTEVKKGVMTSLAERMVEEALAWHSGIYQALSQELIRRTD